MPKKTKQKEKERLRIKIRSYDSKLIDKSVKQVIKAIEQQGGDVVGPIPLPTEVKNILSTALLLCTINQRISLR